MATEHAYDTVVARLSADLRPVRRLPAPPWRAAAWIGIVVAMAVGLAMFCDLAALRGRLAAAPDMWLAVVGSTATAALAALAAFELSVPGRSLRWALLPMPPLLLWVWSSGLGCLRTWGTENSAALEPVREAGHCFTHILMMSVPLMAVMMVMVRRACPLRPNVTALVSGLAIAAASATLLNLDHPFDASATDLLIHLVAVLLVIAINQVITRRADPLRG